MAEQMKVNGKEYQILKLLGKGKGGYSYLCTDGKQQYVLKQIHHEPCEYYRFGDKLEAELRDYERLKRTEIRIPKLLEADLEQERIRKEYIAGDTVFDLILQDKMKKEYLAQMQGWLEKIYYIDFECNDYMEEWNFENWGIKYWSKTPEFLKYVEDKTAATP